MSLNSLFTRIDPAGVSNMDLAGELRRKGPYGWTSMSAVFTEERLVRRARLCRATRENHSKVIATNWIADRSACKTGSHRTMQL